MVRMACVKGDEMPPVQGQEHSPRFLRELQHALIWNRSVRLARLVCCQHVMAQRTQAINHLEREVLVRIERGQGSGGFVLLDRFVDLLPVRGDVGPRVNQVRSPQRGIVL